MDVNENNTQKRIARKTRIGFLPTAEGHEYEHQLQRKGGKERPYNVFFLSVGLSSSAVRLVPLRELWFRASGRLRRQRSRQSSKGVSMKRNGRLHVLSPGTTVDELLILVWGELKALCSHKGMI